jgi:hypothetical protein
MQYCTFKEIQRQLFLYPVKTKEALREKARQNTTHKETQCLLDQDTAPLPYAH